MKTLITVLFVVALLGCETDFAGDCTVNATIRDLTGFDGCGFVLELEDGSRIEPIRPFIFCGTPPLPKEITEDPLYNFEFADGKRVRVTYAETDSVSICMVGPVVKITCITEVITPSGE